VKLQDWVQFQKFKVVVIFEGRGAAGKGGVIKLCRLAGSWFQSSRY
jgi:polyphosphate kinase 2 (PPK2 family)